MIKVNNGLKTNKQKSVKDNNDYYQRGKGVEEGKVGKGGSNTW